MAFFKTLLEIANKNGIYDVGIAGAADPGIRSEFHIVVPPGCKRKTELLGEFIPDSKTPADGTKTIVVPEGKWYATMWVKNAVGDSIVRAYLYSGKYYEEARCNPITQAQAVLFIDANYAIAKAYAEDKKFADKTEFLVQAVACRFAAWYHGLLGADDDAEWAEKDVPRHDDHKDRADHEKFLRAVEDAQPTAILFVAAAVINHYMLNHTTGVGALQGFVLKVAQVTRSLEPLKTMQEKDGKEWYKLYVDMLYFALHPTCKRNGIVAFMDPTHDIAGATRGTVGPISRFKKDDFVAIRKLGFPAGKRKYGLIVAGAAAIRSTGLLAFCPGMSESKAIGGDCNEIVKNPVASHVGGMWYLKFHPRRNTFATVMAMSQANERVATCLAGIAIFLRNCAPTSSLAGSPTFTSMYENEATRWKSWDNLCASFAKSKSIEYDESTVRSIIKHSVAMASAVSLNEAVAELRKAEDELAKIEEPTETDKAAVVAAERAVADEATKHSTLIWDTLKILP